MPSISAFVQSKTTPAWSLRSQTEPREKDKIGSGTGSRNSDQVGCILAEVFLPAPVKGGWAPNGGGCTNTTGEMACGAERVVYGLVGDISPYSSEALEDFVEVETTVL